MGYNPGDQCRNLNSNNYDLLSLISQKKNKPLINKV